MAEQIEAGTLVEAVADFLKSLEPGLQGQQAFHAKVAGNVLHIVARELALQPRAAEAAALAEFLGHEAGQLTPETPGLMAALAEATLAKVAVDNPRYSTFRRMTDAA
jgi:hypothetical protein